MSSVLRKNGWWEEAEPSREHSGMLPGLNGGHVWLPPVWFVLFPSTMCLKTRTSSVSQQTLISCMDPWPFDVVVGGGGCHLIVTRTNTGRHHFLWYYWPPACRLVVARKQSLQSSLENGSGAMTALLHSVTDSCSHSGLISCLNRGRDAKHTFRGVKFFCMSDLHTHIAVLVHYKQSQEKKNK